MKSVNGYLNDSLFLKVVHTVTYFYDLSIFFVVVYTEILTVFLCVCIFVYCLVVVQILWSHNSYPF